MVAENYVSVTLSNPTPELIVGTDEYEDGSMQDLLMHCEIAQIKAKRNSIDETIKINFACRLAIEMQNIAPEHFEYYFKELIDKYNSV